MPEKKLFKIRVARESGRYGVDVPSPIAVNFSVSHDTSVVFTLAKFEWSSSRNGPFRPE